MLKLELEKKGIATIKVLSCFNCGKILPNIEAIKNVRKKAAKRGSKQRDTEYLAIFGGFCSNDCVKAQCNDEKSEDIVKDLYHLYAEMLNSTVRIQKVKFDKNNNVIVENEEE